MIGWRGVDVFGDRFADLAEVREAGGETSGAAVYDPEAGTIDLVDVQPIGDSSTWGTSSSATAYLDRGRVWLDGNVLTTGGSGALGTLPAGLRPGGTVALSVVVLNNYLSVGTYAAAQISVNSSGVATLQADSLVGAIATPLTGLSFKVAP